MPTLCSIVRDLCLIFTADGWISLVLGLNRFHESSHGKMNGLARVGLGFIMRRMLFRRPMRQDVAYKHDLFCVISVLLA